MSVLIALGSDGPLDHALPPDLEGVRIPLRSRGGSAWPSWTSHWCYTCRMARVASRELRNQTRALLERVEAGEEITITVNGRDVARLAPVGSRPRSIDSNVFLDMIEATQADPKLTIELDEMMGAETTDDLRW